MKTRTIVLNYEHNALRFARELIQASKWFTLTPLPDDQWEFVVKNEAGIPQ